MLPESSIPKYPAVYVIVKLINSPATTDSVREIVAEPILLCIELEFIDLVYTSLQ
jgi:hypothetical protein